MNGALGTHGYFIHGRPVPYCFWTENVRDEAFEKWHSGIMDDFVQIMHLHRKIWILIYVYGLDKGTEKISSFSFFIA